MIGDEELVCNHKRDKHGQYLYLHLCICVFVYLGEWVMGCRVGLQSHRGRAGPAGTRAAPA